MASSTKLDEKLEGTNNFWAWKYRIMLVLKSMTLKERSLNRKMK